MFPQPKVGLLGSPAHKQLRYNKITIKIKLVDCFAVKNYNLFHTCPPLKEVAMAIFSKFV